MKIGVMKRKDEHQETYRLIYKSGNHFVCEPYFPS